MDDQKEIFLIKKAWSDSLENDPNCAFGYETIGYVLTRKEADRIISDSPVVTKKRYGWAAKAGKAVYQVESISYFKKGG